VSNDPDYDSKYGKGIDPEDVAYAVKMVSYFQGTRVTLDTGKVSEEAANEWDELVRKALSAIYPVYYPEAVAQADVPEVE
jgi:hypothetical protein